MNCTVQPAASARRAVVSVNGAVIPHAAIARETQNHLAQSPVEAWIAASQALAIRELLLQEAARLGIVATPQTDDAGRAETPEEAAMRALIDREVRTPEPTETELLRFYEANVAKFRSPTISEAAHILIVAPPGDETARTAARAKAQAIAEHLADRPEDFDDLAREFSACPSAKQGGNLGQLSGGETVAEFEEALARLAPGEISRQPVETRYGFHIVKLDRRVEGRRLPFEIVRDRIAGYLTEMVRRRASAQYVAILAGRADLSGVEIKRPETLM